MTYKVGNQQPLERNQNLQPVALELNHADKRYNHKFICPLSTLLEFGPHRFCHRLDFR